VSDVEVQEHIAATPAALYEMVSDLPRMGEWSPENTGGRWSRGGGPSVGATFRGTNRSGWRWWRTVVTVTAADPGRRFAFDVHFAAVPISTWEYTFAPGADGGCLVTETWTDRRPGWMRTVSGPLMAVPDRAAHNRANMEKTLQELKKAAERGTAA
jgi:hypothetical protein